MIESAFSDSNQHIHTTEDTVEHLSFPHMLQHAKLTLGVAYELAATKLWSSPESSKPYSEL